MTALTLAIAVLWIAWAVASVAIAIGHLFPDIPTGRRVLFAIWSCGAIVAIGQAWSWGRH